MFLNAGDIHEGMAVYGVDGSLVGHVGAVWPNASPPDPTEVQYFEVIDAGRRSESVYIPIGAMYILFPGQNVAVECTREECRTLYGRKPELLLAAVAD